ncbi:MAG: hypothetical protein LGB73_04015 [Sulfurovum sp.]|nr:hypothetical protein [Sulfurovum sp.]MCB4775926.1 hypothetical protein [Sulfurovum sp.]
MKMIEKEKLNQLLTIIPNYPMIRLLHFAESGIDMPKILDHFVSQKHYEYQLNCTDKNYFTLINMHLDNTKHTKLQFFSLDRPRYIQQGKLYDFVFVTSIIEEEKQETFLQKLHPLIKNGGNILLFLPKKDYSQRFEWMRLMEKNYYVASNTIDNLFLHYDLLISKKMHGWGG